MSRRRLNVMSEPFHPAYVVWELTLRCDHACRHCGSRALDARPNELGREEALEVVKQLADMGAREVVLIGGEAYLHDAFLDVVFALAKAGIKPHTTTGGKGVTPELARQMKQAGLAQGSVSIDGLEVAHDRLRAQKGSFQRATEALVNLRRAGIVISANTNVNRSNHHDLEALFEHLAAQGIVTWQVQLTTPLGRAADRADMVIQPWDLLSLMPRIAKLKERAVAAGIRLMPGNNLGYFGPEEALLRSPNPEKGQRDHFAGCQAGRFVLGIESDGAVKGCPSLQTAHYVGGTLKNQSLRQIFEDSPELAFARERSVSDLWGFCRDCAFGSTCLGGCTFTAHAILGRPGNNPYCHYRAREHQKQGLRERLRLVEAAPGTPFDNARFELVIEPFDTPEPALDLTDLVKLRRPKPAERSAGPLVPEPT